MKGTSFWQRFWQLIGRYIEPLAISAGQLLVLFSFTLWLSTQHLPHVDNKPSQTVPSQLCQPLQPTAPVAGNEQTQAQVQPSQSSTSNTVTVTAAVVPMKLVFVNNCSVITKIVSNTSQHILPSFYSADFNKQISPTDFITQQYTDIAAAQDLNKPGELYRAATPSSTTSIIHKAVSLVRYVSVLKFSDM